MNNSMICLVLFFAASARGDRLRTQSLGEGGHLVTPDHVPEQGEGARAIRRLNNVWGDVADSKIEDSWAADHAGLYHEVVDEQAPIVVEHQRREWWGFPNYMKDLEIGIESWSEFGRAHGHLGRTCSTQVQCGSEFICKVNSAGSGVCGECALSRDCPEQFHCDVSPLGRRLCIPRTLIKPWTWREVTCTVLIILTALMSAAAGMGGGGVYVPLLLLILGFSTKEAVPLSQTMIVGGAVVNIIMFCGERHPKFPHKPKIDYDVIMMLNPGLAAGVTVGVICNIISPQWLIVTTLIVTLVIALEKSLTKGISGWKKESKMLEEAATAHANGNGPPPGPPKNIKIKMADFQSFGVLARDNSRPLSLIWGCWSLFFVMNLMKAPQCSGLYWLQLLGMLAVCFAFTAAGAKTIVDQQALEGEGDNGSLKWTPKTLVMFPLFSVVAGFLGGFLGIGGGIIMGPLLLELGMIAEVSQATTAMFVFLSSSLATIQFVLLGKSMPEYALWFTTWVIIATFAGQTIIDYVLKMWQRSSLIVLSIAGIIAGSLVMMSLIGVSDVYTDVSRGAYMGFTPSALCAQR